MNLSEYLRSNGLTQAQFAARVNRAQPTVSGWLNGAVPDGPALQAIYEATGGAVTPNDMLGIELRADSPEGNDPRPASEATPTAVGG